MQTSLAFTALTMGLFGGPHCIAMCGAACAGIGSAAGSRASSAMWIFQLGRVVGYGLLGALSATSMQGLGWLTVQSAMLRPVWSLFHVAVFLLGLILLFRAKQPVWLESLGQRLWKTVKFFATGRGQSAPLVLGIFWALLPCGLLYSALLVATMAGSTESGAMVMMLFAAGTSISMMLGPWLWLKLQGSNNLSGGFGQGKNAGHLGIRLAGLSLAASAAWALWMGLMHNTAPWCVVPAA